MFVFLLFLSGILMVICLATVIETNDDVLSIFAGLGGFLFLVLFFFSMFTLLSQAEQVRTDRNHSLCTQIPTAQWISDNNTCIKDGKVIIP
jgi:hypothetical protein